MLGQGRIRNLLRWTTRWNEEEIRPEDCQEPHATEEDGAEVPDRTPNSFQDEPREYRPIS